MNYECLIMNYEFIIIQSFEIFNKPRYLANGLTVR